MNQPYPVKLIWVDDPRYEYPLSSASFTFGRDATCSLSLQGNTKASRQHSEIIYHEGQYWVRDLGSQNGTRLNGNKIQQEMLFDGDCIQLAGLRFRFVNPYTPAPPDRARIQNTAFQGPRDEEGTGTIIQVQGVAPAKGPNKALVAVGVAGALLVLMIGYFALTGKGGSSRRFPDATKYGVLAIQLKEEALISIPYSGVMIRNEEVFSASPVGSDQFVIKITGREPGTGDLYVRGADKKTWYVVQVLVEALQSWPPGWEDPDRQKEADKAVAEGDLHFKNRLDFVAMLKAYYLYKKASRLYTNCRHTSPENNRIVERLREIQPELDNKEYSLVQELKSAWTAGDFTKAKESVGQLLRLFPPDGSGTAVMALHGDPVKHRQYSMLNDFLGRLASESAGTPSGS